MSNSVEQNYSEAVKSQLTRRGFVKVAGATTAAMARWMPKIWGEAVENHEGYVTETDPLVLKKLDRWQDWKFGFMLHWGPYSQWGVVESWSICSEDVPWCKRPSNISYVDYVKKYEQLPTTFCPLKFNPSQWAAAAQGAGMNYVVFTTKHHDGFSMFDTRQSNYRITAPNVPFHQDPRANIAKQVFEAFREQHLGIGAYFSKPDWHNPDYWAPEWATPDRNVNYDTRKHPERWQKFVEFVHAQIGELTTEYGELDILWMDGGWVDGKPNLHALPGSGEVPWPQDIKMVDIASFARKNQPGLIMVNRAEGGPWENYRTPEQQIPDKALPYPWETCMTMGNSWSYVPNDKYKPSRELVHKLIEIVAKGGNFLLNVGPDANGELPAVALDRMHDIGSWMKINGRAIYATRPIAPYSEGKLRFTRLKDGSLNMIHLLDENEPVPEKIVLNSLTPASDARIQLLGTAAPLSWRREDGRSVIDIPVEVRKQLATTYAFTIHVSALQVG